MPPEEDKDYMGYSIIDGETGMMLSVLMVCGCGNPVIRAYDGQDEQFFFCEHCDRTCTTRPCEFCEAHFTFDAEATKAEAEAFRNERYEEEDED